MLPCVTRRSRDRVGARSQTPRSGGVARRDGYVSVPLVYLERSNAALRLSRLYASAGEAGKSCAAIDRADAFMAKAALPPDSEDAVLHARDRLIAQLIAARAACPKR